MWQEMSEQASRLESLLWERQRQAEERDLGATQVATQVMIAARALEIEALQDQAYNLKEMHREIHEAVGQLACLTNLVQSAGVTLDHRLANLVGMCVAHASTISSGPSGG